VSRPTGRAGFTLIEIIVVIAIIGILAALLAGVVINLLAKGPELVDRTNLTNLNGGIQRFYNEYKCYPPSKLFLANSRALYMSPLPAGVSPTLAKTSLEYLGTMFPKLDWTQPIDWSGGLATTTLNTTGVILEGDQCLVFCLGGIPTRDAQGNFGCLGFNKASGYKNPTASGGERFTAFEFQSDRLVQRAGSSFLSYNNPHGKPQPYAYFSSYKSENGYATISSSYTGNPSDCAGLGVAPYYKATTPITQYHNPKGYQLISAGTDGQFAPGGQWTAANAPNIGAAGKDDISNFHPNFLGTP